MTDFLGCLLLKTGLAGKVLQGNEEFCNEPIELLEVATSEFVLSLRLDSPVLKILLLEVFEESRGKGLGRKVVEVCEMFAEKRGFKKISLLSSHEAKTFWEKCGFVDTGGRVFVKEK